MASSRFRLLASLAKLIDSFDKQAGLDPFDEEDDNAWEYLNSTIAKDRPAIIRVEAAAEECLRSFLVAAANILRAVNPDVSLRSLLTAFVQATPAKPGPKESLLLTLGKDNSDILALPIHHIANKLNRAVVALDGLRRESRELHAKGLECDSGPATLNGPIEDEVFLWRRKRYVFPKKVWLLLKVLWEARQEAKKQPKLSEKEQSLKFAVHESSVICQVKGNPNQLKQLQKRTQDLLLEHLLPFKIIRPERKLLWLKKLTSVTSRNRRA